MRIYIPTRGRAHKQTTWNNLPAAWKEVTQLVVDADEAHLHGDKPLLVLPNGVSGLNGMGQVRQWLMENADAERVLMLDAVFKWKSLENLKNAQKVLRDFISEIEAGPTPDYVNQ